MISGAAPYSGGIIIDPADSNVAYSSRQVDENGEVSTSGVYQLFRHVTTDGWATNTATQLTFGPHPTFRPRINEAA